MATPSKIEIHPKYTYNHGDDCYVINVKNRVKPLVLKGFKVRAIQMAISNAVTPSQTGREICAKYCLSEEDFDEIKKAFGLTRDSFPLTDEEITDSTVEQSADKILEEKRSAVYQAAEKAEWKETQKDAEQWREFRAGSLDPFANVLDLWKCPPIPTIKAPKATSGGKTLCVALSDLHWGARANAMYMYNDKGGWDSHKTTKVVESYAGSVLEACAERTYKFDKVAVFLMGDILHSVSGKTCRGTELKFDIVREEQFDFALKGLSYFLQRLAGAFPDLEVHTTLGNHNPEAEIGLYRALEMLFSKQKSVKFFHHTSRPASFVLGSTLFLMEHGQSNEEKAYVPLAESKLENHVQNLLLQKPELLKPEIKSKVFIMGDRHNFKHLEFDNFEFIMFSTSLGADEHAAANNWNNRARQSCLVLDEWGLKEVLHFYTDQLLSK